MFFSGFHKKSYFCDHLDNMPMYVINWHHSMGYYQASKERLLMFNSILSVKYICIILMHLNFINIHI